MQCCLGLVTASDRSDACMNSPSFAARRADHCAPSGSSLNAKNRGARRACLDDTAFHVGARAVVGAHPNRPGSRSSSHGAPIDSHAESELPRMLKVSVGYRGAVTDAKDFHSANKRPLLSLDS